MYYGQAKKAKTPQRGRPCDMMRISRKNRTTEVVLKMLNSDRSVPEVAMGIGENLLYKWKADEKSRLSPEVGRQNAELQQLRKQLKQAEMERDILKKALAIFSRVN